MTSVHINEAYWKESLELHTQRLAQPCRVQCAKHRAGTTRHRNCIDFSAWCQVLLFICYKIQGILVHVHCDITHCVAGNPLREQ